MNMKLLIGIFSTFAIAFLFGCATLDSTPDEQAVRDQTEKWFEIWSQGDEPFTGDGLETVFRTGQGNILVFDDFAGDVVEIESVEEYISTWVPVMEDTLSSHRIRPDGEIRITMGQDLALSTFVWVSDSITVEGEPISLRQYATHVWQKFDGEWRLIHEHLTSDDNP